MATKKAVFLFGAGAVLDWGGPRTICNGTSLLYIKEHGSNEIRNRVCCLTHLIIEIGFKSKDGKRVTQKIFDLLLGENGNESKSINFETVIDFIDEILNYYSGNHILEETKNFKSFFVLKEFTDNLFDYKISNKTSSTYSINIPGFPIDSEDYIPISISPEQKYCELLLKNLYQGLIGHISKYSYQTSGHSVIYKEVNRSNNELFVNWCKKLVATGHCLRMHTLNYDRIFKVLLQDKGINVFEGFDLETSSTNPGELIFPNIKRISTDYASHCFYNLHGSGYWDISNENIGQLNGYQIYLTGIPEMNYQNTIVEISKNRWALLSNIITGYQKVLKTTFSPFRQMLSAFDRDCIEANKLFLVGYSFGDEHINDIIRNARKFNSDVEIIVINPSFNDKQFMYNFLLHWGAPKGIIYQKSSEKTITSKDFKVKIFQKTFLEFLENDNV